MKQSTLFDVQETPKRSDPATSHEAAAEVESKLARLFGERPSHSKTESPARARRSDPATSHEAAADVESKLASLQAEALERARDVCRRYGNATANEIALVDGTVIESLRKRVHELVCKQMLIFAGTRLCSVTGKRCRAYKVANIEVQK